MLPHRSVFAGCLLVAILFPPLFEMKWLSHRKRRANAHFREETRAEAVAGGPERNKRLKEQSYWREWWQSPNENRQCELFNLFRTAEANTARSWTVVACNRIEGSRLHPW
jgi:hypothetical protein